MGVYEINGLDPHVDDGITPKYRVAMALGDSLVRLMPSTISSIYFNANLQHLDIVRHVFLVGLADCDDRSSPISQ